MNNKKSLIYSIIALLLIAAIVAGSTYAYFQWTSGEDDRTGVNVTIEAEQVTMHIEPETTVYTNLRPTNNCNNSYAYGDALVTIENHTGAMAIPSFKLNVKVTKNGTGTLTSDDLSHIHYAVVLLETNSNGSKGAGVLNEGSCANPANFNLENSNLYFAGITEGSVTGTFQTVSTTGEWSDLPSNENTYLPRQFNTVNVTSHGATYLGMPHSTSYQWFRVYVWMDHEYVYTNTGSEVSDPLQNAKIEVTWSENSMIEQVSSIISGGDEEVTPVKAAGYYASDGAFTPWDTLATNRVVYVVEGVLSSVSSELTGELVIDDSVTIIGDFAFENSKLTSVIIPDSVTSIGYASFAASSLISVIIPDSVTNMGDAVFVNSALENVILSNSITKIGNDTFNGSKLKSVIIPDSVTTLGSMAFLGNNFTSIIIPNSVTSIGGGCFADAALTSIVIPSSITEIMPGTFNGTKLTNIVIPKTVMSIGADAFGNTLLTDVYYEGTETEWNQITINNAENTNALLINATKHFNYTGE